jgi:hypothetical protein
MGLFTVVFCADLCFPKRQEDVDLFAAIQANIESHYGQKGSEMKPQWIEDEEHLAGSAALHVMTKAKYNSLTTQDIQEILRTHNIVVSQYDTEELNFDSNGLGSLGGLNILRSIHGAHIFCFLTAIN